MVGASLLALVLSQAPSPLAPAPRAALRLSGEFAAPTPWSVDLGLQAERMGLDGRNRTWHSGLAQSAQRPGRQGARPAPAAPTPEPASPPAAEQTSTQAPAQASGTGAAAAQEPAAEEAPAEQCDIDCETAREDAQLARYVMRNRARTLRTHRAFAIATWGTMLATMALGTVQAVNQDTWFGRGNCASDPEGFGCQRSTLITGLHLGFSIATTAMYTATGVMAVTAPDPQNASEGDSAPERRLRLHKTLAWVHATGMVLLPILGILSSRPQILGINDQDDRAVFSRAMRTTHLLVGYTTFAALTWAGILEF